jgi:hypothetical protein
LAEHLTESLDLRASLPIPAEKKGVNQAAANEHGAKHTVPEVGDNGPPEVEW